METRTEEIFLKKVELIAEIIEVVGPSVVKPNVATILITRSMKESNTKSEWNGYLSDLKDHMQLYSNHLEQHVVKSSINLQKVIEDRFKQQNVAIRNIERRVNSVSFDGNQITNSDILGDILEETLNDMRANKYL